MAKRKIIPYDPKLKELARQLRNDSTKTEIFLWLKLKGKQMYGYDFHRQKPIDHYILDFFCYELMLGIEVDGYSHEFLEVYNKDTVKEKRREKGWKEREEIHRKRKGGERRGENEREKKLKEKKKIRAG